MKKKEKAEPKYKCLVGINHGKDGKRVEPGDIITDLSAKQIKDLLEINAIIEVSE